MRARPCPRACASPLRIQRQRRNQFQGGWKRKGATAGKGGARGRRSVGDGRTTAQHNSCNYAERAIRGNDPVRKTGNAYLSTIVRHKPDADQTAERSRPDTHCSSDQCSFVVYCSRCTKTECCAKLGSSQLRGLSIVQAEESCSRATRD